MSLILEALRKSEAERRLGSAPELLSAMPVMRVSAPRRRWPIPVAIVAAALIVAVAIYGWPQRNAPLPAAPSAASTATTPVAAPNPHQSLPVAPTAVSPPHATPPPAPTRTPAPVSVPSPVAITLTPSVVAPAPVAAPPTPIAQATDAKTATAEPSLLSLGDLSADERGGLPALKVTMHVYADDPAKRFMIVDGQRVGEGARLADGVVLVRIRRDGAEIDLRGRRLLLPKP